MSTRKNKTKTPWYAAGLHFDCNQCGNCCSGPDEGYIWITKSEIKMLADYLKIPVKELQQKYLEKVGVRTTIVEQPVTKDCIFLQKIAGKKGCIIYPVRPNQCRTWPFWKDNLTSPDEWNETAQKCNGINKGKLYTLEEIEKILKQKKWWDDGKQQSDF